MSKPDTIGVDLADAFAAENPSGAVLAETIAAFRLLPGPERMIAAGVALQALTTSAARANDPSYLSFAFMVTHTLLSALTRDLELLRARIDELEIEAGRDGRRLDS